LIILPKSMSNYSGVSRGGAEGAAAPPEISGNLKLLFIK